MREGRREGGMYGSGGYLQARACAYKHVHQAHAWTRPIGKTGVCF